MKPKRPRKPARSKRPASKRSPRAPRDPLLGRMAGADHREVGGVAIDTTRAANGRV